MEKIRLTESKPPTCYTWSKPYHSTPRRKMPNSSSTRNRTSMRSVWINLQRRSSTKRQGTSHKFFGYIFLGFTAAQEPLKTRQPTNVPSKATRTNTKTCLPTIRSISKLLHSWDSMRRRRNRPTRTSSTRCTTRPKSSEKEGWGGCWI